MIEIRIQSVHPASTIISGAALIIAFLALLNTYISARRQEAIARKKLVAELHEKWWSDDMDRKRHVVWQELELWRDMGDESPAIKHFSKSGPGWSIDSDERRAHARVLFFFADLNRLMHHKVIDEEVAFEMFGVSQYDWFKDYFAAIRTAIKNREGNPLRWPRYVSESEDFELRLQAWKCRRRAD